VFCDEVAGYKCGREIVGRGEAAEGCAKVLPQLTKVPLRDTPER